MKKYLLILGSIFLLTACSTNVENQGDGGIDPNADQETSDSSNTKDETLTTENNVYEWKEFGISFAYPQDMYVHSSGSVRIISKNAVLKGDELDLHDTVLRIESETLEETLSSYSDNEQFSSKELTFGSHEFTFITFFSDYGDYMVKNYTYPFDGKVFILSTGEDSSSTQTAIKYDETTTDIILNTISFEGY